jgi:hypothetical protein
MKKTALVFMLFTLCAGFVFSADFGLLLDQNIEAENNHFSYTPALIPWLSLDNGRGLSLYLSAMLSLKYNNYDDNISSNDGLREPVLLPELSRFSVTWRPGQRYSIEAGRVAYTDALGQTASGLFDGLRFQAAAPIGGVNIGAFYTGLLYKETAKIIMTGNDAAEYAKPVEDFNSYGASKRVFAFGRLDVPLMDYHSFFFEVLAQFDLNGNDEKLDSQYAQTGFELLTQKNVRILGGFVFEAMENGDGEFIAACGALASLETNLPGSLKDSLKFTAKFSSGPSDKIFSGFTPLSSITQGMIFTGTFSGLWQANLKYGVRILPSLFAETSVSYFGKTYNETGSEGNLYGGEIWASLGWQPLEDIRATLSGGAFIPGTGNAYPAGTDVMWKITAGLSLSF